MKLKLPYAHKPLPNSTGRRLFLGFAAAALAGFAGMLQPAFAQNHEVTLRISHGFQGKNASMIESVVERFEELHPSIKIELAQRGERDDEHFKTLLRSGVIGDLPDLAHIGLTYSRELVHRGYAKPIKTFVDPAYLTNEFGVPAPLLASTKWDGAVYGVPFATTVPVVYYNLDLIKKAGIDLAQLPSRWGQLVNIAQAVAGLGQADIGGYIEYTSYNAWMFQNLLSSNGEKLVDPTESKIVLDAAAGLEALNMLAEFGKAMNADMTQKQARQAFNAGTVGILIRSASGIDSVKKAVDDHFDLGIGAFPVNKNGGHLVGASNGVVIFTDDNDKRDAVRAYIDFLVGPEGQSILVEKTGYIPVGTKAVESEKQFGSYYREHPIKKELLSNLPTTSDWYSFPQNSQRIFDVYVEEMRKVITHQQRPDDALKEMIAVTQELSSK